MRRRGRGLSRKQRRDVSAMAEAVAYRYVGLLLQEATHADMSGNSFVTQAFADFFGKFTQEMAASVIAQMKKACDNAAQRIETSVLKHPALYSQLSPQIWPEGTQLVESRGRNVVVGYAQSPMARYIRFKGRDPSEYLMSTLGIQEPALPPDGFTLSFPWMLFLVHFMDGTLKGMFVYYLSGPLTATQTPLQKCNLPNIWAEDGHFCAGKYESPKLAMPKQLTSAIKNFWASRFTSELTDNFSNMAGRDRRLASMEAWADATRRDPNFATTVTWEPTGITLEEKVKKLLNDPEETTAWRKMAASTAAQSFMAEVPRVVNDCMEELKRTHVKNIPSSRPASGTAQNLMVTCQAFFAAALKKRLSGLGGERYEILQMILQRYTEGDG